MYIKQIRPSFLLTSPSEKPVIWAIRLPLRIMPLSSWDFITTILQVFFLNHDPYNISIVLALNSHSWREKKSFI